MTGAALLAVMIAALLGLHHLLCRTRMFTEYILYGYAVTSIVFIGATFIGRQDPNYSLSNFEYAFVVLVGIVGLFVGSLVGHRAWQRRAPVETVLAFPHAQVNAIPLAQHGRAGIRVHGLPIILIGFLVSHYIWLSSKVDPLSSDMVTYLLSSRTMSYARQLEDNTGSLPSVLAAVFRCGLLVYGVLYARSGYLFRAAALYLLVLGGMFLVFVTRLELIIILALPVIYYHFYVRPVPAIAWLGLALVFPILMAILNVYRTTGDVSLTEVLSTENVSLQFKQDLAPLDGFNMIYDRWDHGTLAYEYGQTYLDTLLTFIPRSIWASKPITAFEPRYTLEIFGTLAGPGGASMIWVFTAWGEGLAQGGIIGVFINLFIYGFVASVTARYLINRGNYCLLFYYLVLAGTFLRGSCQALLIMSTIFVAGTWYATRSLIRTKAAP